MHVLNMIRHIKILFVHFSEFFPTNFYYLLWSNNKRLISLVQKLQVKREQMSTRSIDIKTIFTWSKIKSNLVFTFTFPSVDIFFYFVQKFVFVHWSIHEEIVKTMVFTKTTWTKTAVYVPSCKLQTGYGLSLLIVVAVFVINVCIKHVLSHRWCGAVQSAATVLGLLFLSFALVLFTRACRLLFRLSLSMVRSLIFKCFVTSSD